MDDLPDFAAFDVAYERRLFGPLGRLASRNIEDRPAPAGAPPFGQPEARQWDAIDRQPTRKWRGRFGR